MKLKGLEFRARVVVEGFLAGLHRSPYHGFSAEFSEYRQYAVGDDPRYLDWRLFARSDRYYIKRFEDETNLNAWVLLDLSRSMEFGTVEYTKADYARTFAATLAYFLSLQRDAVGLVTFDESIREVVPPRYRAGHTRRLLATLEQSVAGASTDVVKPLRQVAESVSRRGLLLLVSDLLTPIEALRDPLAGLRARGHQIAIIRVLDLAELTFPFEQASMFRDVETGRKILIDPESARASYQQEFDAHASALTELTDELGISLLSVTTETPLDEVLFQLVAERVAPRANVNRNTQGGAT